MKALTLTEPYATAIAHRLKGVETRGWRTDYVGWVAIHAAKGLKPDDAAVFASWLGDYLLNAGINPYSGLVDPETVAKLCDPTLEFGNAKASHMMTETRGKVVAVAWLVGCYRMQRVHAPGWGVGYRGPLGPTFPSAKERDWGHWEDGRYAWVFGEAVRFDDPIPARGALGLWDWQQPEGFVLPEWRSGDTTRSNDGDPNRVDTTGGGVTD